MSNCDKIESSAKMFEFEMNKSYTISFNCMRNGLKIPLRYSFGCVYALYDLA
jgi:hypothetical protein